MVRRRLDRQSPEKRRRRRLGRGHDQGRRIRTGADRPLDDGPRQEKPQAAGHQRLHTLVKTASEFVRRHEQQLHATLHQRITVTAGAARITVSLDIEPDDEHPQAQLSAHDDGGELLAQVKVAPSFKLNRTSAVAWADNNFNKPVER